MVKTEDFLAYLVDRRLVRLDEQFALHSSHFRHAKQELCRHFLSIKPDGREFREKLGSPEICPAFVETFDRLKWTRRLGEERVLWRPIPLTVRMVKAMDEEVRLLSLTTSGG